MSDDYLWNPAAAPDPEIQRLESLLRPMAYRPQPLRENEWPRAQRTTRIRVMRWSALAAGALLVAGGLHAARRSAVHPWQVTAVRGAPVVRAKDGSVTSGALPLDGVVETDARSSAALTVGRIGQAELAPDSRLRLVSAGASEHRLALERGTLHANIDAPPRYFLVQTPSALAVDLGCVYTLSTDEQGNGRLVVEEGEVELVSGAVTVTVPAGNTASLRNGVGPGLPYPVRASEALRRAVAVYDADPSSDVAVEGMIAASDSGNTITLWHLFQRADSAQRERVFVRLAAIAPPPASVTRARVVRGESGALQRWRTELQRDWATEPPVWRRVWVALGM